MSDEDAGQQPTRSSPRLPAIRFASLLLAVALLGIAGFTGFVTVQRMIGSRDLVLHTYRVRSLLKDLRSGISESHADFDLYQLSNNSALVPDMDSLLQKELASISELQSITLDNSAQQLRLSALRPTLLQDINQLRSCVLHNACITAAPSDQTSVLAQLFERRQSMSEALRTMEAMEDDLLQDRLRTWRRLFTRMVIILVASFLLALMLLFYNFNLLFREVERRREQELFEKSSAESFRMLSARILELQDIERRKIARELHDSVGQFLAGLKLNLGSIQRREPETASQTHKVLAESLELTDRAIGEVRTISHLLHPPLLDELGFHSAARWYAEGFAKRSGIQVNLHLSEIADRLPREIELAMFRVLQESLTNVHRHAQATKVDIILECTDDDVTLTVSDDGKGLNREMLHRFRAGQAAGIGLAGMRERLAELGGTLEVESETTGTHIQATLPTRECDSADPPPQDIVINPAH